MFNVIVGAALLVPIIGSIGLFSFLAVASWSDARRREREAYYNGETLKKIADSQGMGASSALEFLREQEKYAARRRLEGQRLGGLITVAVGVALMIFMYAIADVTGLGKLGATLVGLIPFLIGVALLAYSYLLAPKEQA